MRELSGFRAPFLSSEKIRIEADAFRKKYGKDKIPVEIDEIIEFDLGINIVPKDGLYSECSTNAILSFSGREIRVDNSQYQNSHLVPQIRYSLAREVGHLVLHRDIIHKIRPDNPEEWKYLIKTIPEREYGFIEYHAYEFAGRLLVPRERLIEELTKRGADIESVYKEFPDIDDDMVIDQVAASIARVFLVSYQVIAKRIRNEEVWRRPS